ncbi:MAG TPA: histidine phosphatase family protein [Thermohalobaculum sp.]|nr:histidine phosphatase family protein [Thermohalobaculum sp.]
MKTLMLMRHAEAGWTEPGMDDHDRRLSEQGRLEVPIMARWLEAQTLRPDRVLCSSAERTRETAALLCEVVPALPQPEVSDALYHAGPGTIMDHVRRLPGDCDCVLLIGHEPGLGSLLRILDGQAGPTLRRAYNQFSTAAIAVLEANVEDWAGVGVANVKFVAFRTPRALFEIQAPGA